MWFGLDLQGERGVVGKEGDCVVEWVVLVVEWAADFSEQAAGEVAGLVGEQVSEQVSEQVDDYSVELVD